MQPIYCTSFFFLIFLPPPVSLGMTKIRGTAQAEQSGDKVGEVVSSHFFLMVNFDLEY